MPKSPNGIRCPLWPRCAGSTIWHSINEKTRQKITVAAVIAMISPTPPTLNNSGVKASDGGQHPERDRHQYVLRAFDGARELSRASLMGDIDALADHNGIVDQHAKCQE